MEHDINNWKETQRLNVNSVAMLSLANFVFVSYRQCLHEVLWVWLRFMLGVFMPSYPTVSAKAVCF